MIYRQLLLIAALSFVLMGTGYAQDDQDADLKSYLETFLGDEEEAAESDDAVETTTSPFPALDTETEEAGQSETIPAVAPPESPLPSVATINAQRDPNRPLTAADVGGEDALPPIQNTQMTLETRGFDNAASGTVNVNVSSDGLENLSPAELQAEIRQEAYEAAITGLFPLEPDQIRRLLQKYDTVQRAVEEPVEGVVNPVVTVETISLDPGVAPPVLNTAAGYITTLNILDVTGAPWPIQDVSWAGDFEVIEPEEGGHILRVTPLNKSAYGNMSLRLLTLKTPVTIRLSTSTDSVQYRVDARIPEYGPYAEAPLIDAATPRVAGGGTIMSVLDGVIPGNAEKLMVDGVDGRTSAYRVGTMTYLRTPLTLLSPGWEQSVSSADGMKVYALADTPVVLLSDNGRMARARLGADGNL